MYVHGEHLQDIQSAVKKPNELSKRLMFCIFDIADSTEIYKVRRNLLLKGLHDRYSINPTIWYNTF